MKKFLVTLIGLGLFSTGWLILDQTIKGGDDESPKGANCSPATAKQPWNSMM